MRSSLAFLALRLSFFYASSLPLPAFLDCSAHSIVDALSSFSLSVDEVVRRLSTEARVSAELIAAGATVPVGGVAAAAPPDT